MVAEERMIKWICDHNRLDMIRNKLVREKVKVASIEDNVNAPK